MEEEKGVVILLQVAPQHSLVAVIGCPPHLVLRGRLDSSDARDHVIDKLHSFVVPHRLIHLDSLLDSGYTHLAHHRNDP